MSENAPVLTQVDDSVARITINRPDRRNALSPEVVRGIAEALQKYEDDQAVRAVVLTGAGDRAFCAGGDLGGMMADSRVEQHWQRSEVGDLLAAMRSSRLPIVARVNGHALAGGFGLMLGCDLVVASEDAQMGTPEVNIGLWPFMITAVIQRDIPRKIALELMLTGKRLTSAEARELGFANRVVPRADLNKATDELVGELLGKSPLILALGKRSFYRAEDMSFRDGVDYLAGMLTVCLESEDTVEGVTAFLQKRAPEWKGR
ncbi:MAG: enoyl-CoA hydratase/isomerase family protein [Actinomycetota bacterium]|nr:enoyl-CoA hydratase/isomerase family protein [Actinomycetota bacterium]